ncbi:aminotransferase class IV [Microbacterium sp. ET2]|uniref:aminotransferase class IV n=1 Tax=Microbacterium albipurpureum TaxID=3050384 RepID=UPI00259D05B2|nr:aminotransferase class IV [Microbacterium sp. ET2 (Ac-2212)]WJL96210.1 aminotransferase class IV [Microbacterium sp. ET2 (Ac-2212)]
MTRRHALLIDPVASDDDRSDFADTLSAVDPAGPVLSLGELSAQRGDGVFESIGVVDGHPQEVTAHLERLAHSARLCDLPAPHPGQWRAAVAEIASRCEAGEYVIKLLLSRGVDHGPAPTAWVTASPAPDFSRIRREGVRVVTLDRGVDSGASARAPWLLLGAKTLSYAVNMAAIREANRRGADDAVFVSSDGVVLEAPTASVILRFGDRFVTPEPAAGILHGTTQLSLFRYLAGRGFDVGYDTISVDQLRRAESGWLVSSIRLAAPIVGVDDREIAMDAALTASITEYLLSPRE